MAGAFRVSQEVNDSRDICFEICSTDGVIPREQLDLRDRVQAALTVIRIACPHERQFREYFAHLLSLAQTGLVGETANPDLALRALDGLKQDITAREAGRVKNSYMKALGLRAAVAIACFSIIAFMLAHTTNFLWPRMLAVFEMGTMLGIWLSFGTRKPVIKFEELHILEEDRLEPTVRLVFAGLLAGTLAISFYLRVINISLGSLTTDSIATNGWASFFFGILSGVSEKALSTNISRQAAAITKG